ncbi:MAG: hypothetical protein EA417_23075 [Gammaproteobacteria bacterium]|nr:MAG: hypothetical protein EA417_23075 [Gammaproteobacteria bacterium]
MGQAEEQAFGARLCDGRCAACHAGTEASRVPSLDAMRQLPARRVLASLTEGVMQEQAAGLSQAEQRALGDAVCRFRYRLSVAATAVPGVVFAPVLDGQLRAFAVADVALLWSFDTVRAFDTINDVAAEGGSMDNAGAVAEGSMLFVQSG